MASKRNRVALPYTIGHENAGWVHAAGPAVTNVSVGDAVIVLEGRGILVPG